MHKNISALFIVIFALCTGNMSLLAPQEQVRMMRFVPGSDDKLLVLVTADGVVKICDAQSGTVLQEICTPGLQAAALTAVGRIENEWKGYTVDKVLPVKVWDMIIDCLSPSERLSLQLSCESVKSLVDSRLQRKCAPCQKLEGLDAVFPGPAKVTSISLSCEGKTLVASLASNGTESLDESVCIYSLSEQTGKFMLAKTIAFKTLSVDAPTVHVACSHGGNTIAFSVWPVGCGCTIEVWHKDLADDQWKALQSVSLSRLMGVIEEIKFSPAGDRLAVIAKNSRSRLSETRDIFVFAKNQSGQWRCCSSNFFAGGRGVSLQFSKDESCVLACTRIAEQLTSISCNPQQKMACNVVQLLKGKCPRGAVILSMAFASSGGHRAIIRLPDGGNLIWQANNYSDWQCKHTLGIQCDHAEFCSDGDIAACWSDSDGSVQILDCCTGSVFQSLPSEGSAICYVTFSLDGKWLALAYKDGMVKIHLLA